jgi:uncharacterized coiled-coil DUF342 family protein
VYVAFASPGKVMRLQPVPVDKQVEENAVLERLVSRHSLQLAAMNLNATQMEELKRLQKQSVELHDQMRAAQVKANDLSRQVHQVSLQWTKTCNRREKLKRGLAEKGVAPAAPSSDEVRAATALETRDARLEKATKALKVAIQAGVGSARRQQQLALVDVSPNHTASVCAEN